MAIQSPTSPTAFRPQGVTFSGGGSLSGEVKDKPDVFERQAGPASPQPERPTQTDAFAWVKDLIAEARQDPKASLSELLHTSEIKRRANALLTDVRQFPPLSSVVSKANFKEAPPEDLDALLAQADDSIGQMDSMLSALASGKPVQRPVLPDGHPLKAQFTQETADLKARQQREREAVVKSAQIEDTPELRAELLKQGAVASEAEIPAFLKKFGL